MKQKTLQSWLISTQDNDTEQKQKTNNSHQHLPKQRQINNEINTARPSNSVQQVINFNAKQQTTLTTSRQHHKQNKTIRITSQNINNLGIDPKSIKSREVTTTIGKDQSDVWLVQETGIAWHQTAPHESWNERMRAVNTRKQYGFFANNTNEEGNSNFQYGGVGVIIKNHHVSRKITQGKDPRSLGRWAWVELSGRNRKTITLISAYRPVENKTAGIHTVFEQHVRQLATTDMFENPREVMLSELSQFIQSLHEQNKSIVLGMDANQNIGSRRMTTSAHECGLIERVSEYTHDKPNISTCIKNSKHETIDGIWTSPDLDILSAGYHTENDMIGSDHLALWVELSYQQALGREDTTARPIICSLLNTENPKLVSRYIQATKRMQIQSGTLQKLKELEKITPDKWTKEQDIQFDQIMSQDVLSRKTIASKIRRKFTGKKVWSPRLQEIRDTRRLWTLTIRMQSGYTVKPNQIRRLAKKLKVTDVFQVDKAEAKERKKQADAMYQQDDEAWLVERKKFLKKLDDANARRKGIKRASEWKCRVGIERQRQMGKKISQIKNKPQVTVSTLYATNLDGSKMELNTIREMEQQCIKTNIRKFTQANNTEATQGQLLRRIGEIAEQEGAEEILQGKFDTDGLSKYMTELIEGLKRHDTQIQDKTMFYISSSDHQKVWRKQKARTGSDTRGLSYSHFKSATMDPTISEVDCRFRNIPFSKGTSPLLWQQITDFQILKKAGVFDVELMRTIQLLMADFNMNNKALGKLVMAAGETIHYFPEEITGSRKFRKSAVTILNKVLVNDLWRLKRITAALCSTDAKSCYDRVIHWIAILAMRRIDIPFEPLKSLFVTIQRAVHSIAIENNLSKDSYDGKNISPVLHGLGQGNGAAPTIWVMVSTVLIQMLHRRGHGAEFFAALSKNLETICGFMFVDDMDVIEAPSSPWATELETMYRMQQMMNRWAGGLRASGGKLEPAKSHWYLISLDWRRDHWHYKHPKLPKGLTVDDESGKQIKLTRLHVRKATETLGIYTTMDGDHTAQINKLKNITNTVAAKYRKAHVTPNEIWTIFQTTLMKTWDYPKVAATLTQSDWDLIIGLIIPTILNKAGIAKTFPRLLIFAPLKFQGLGLHHPWLDQNVKQIECLLLELMRKTFTGSLITQVIEQTLLEIGLPRSIGQQNWSVVASYVTDSWIKHLLMFAQQYGIQLNIRTHELKPKRKHDTFIMSYALRQQLTTSELRRVNNIRQALQVTTVSDISNLQGTRLNEDMWAGKINILRYTSKIWPRTGRIYPSDIKLWQKVLTDLTGSPLNRKLRRRLGSWFTRPDSTWKLSTASGCLYQRIGHWWFDHSPLVIRSSRGEQWFHTRQHNGRTTEASALPNDACNADVIISKHRIKARMVPPIYELPQPKLEWWQDPVLQAHCTGEDHIYTLMQSLAAGTLVAVSDGSYKDRHATAAFVLEVHDIPTPLVTGTIVVPGHTDSLTPFRAEMFGILATIAWIEKHGTQYGIEDGTVRCGCDNQAEFKRLSSQYPLSSQQADLDLIFTIQEAIRLSCYKWELFWVKGHQDDVKSHLTQEEQMNVLSDSLAKSCWANTVQNPRPDPTWSSILEPFHIIHHGQKITTFDPHHMYDRCSQNQLQQYWSTHHDLTPTQMSQIDWDILGKAMKTISPEIRRWTTKHLSGFSATSKVMFRRGGWKQDLCPVCLDASENADHIWTCKSLQSADNIQHKLEALNTKLTKFRTSPAIIHVINVLFPPTLGQPTRKQTILTAEEQQLLQHQRSLGILNFFRGCLSRTWIDHQKRWLLSKATRWKPLETRWAVRLVKAILELSWNLWRQRCDYLHSDAHPWNQRELSHVINEIRALQSDPSQFAAADQSRIHQLGQPSHLRTLEDARKALASLHAAQTKHRTYKTSLQPQRLLLRQWLATSHASPPSDDT